LQILLYIMYLSCIILTYRFTAGDMLCRLQPHSFISLIRKAASLGPLLFGLLIFSNMSNQLVGAARTWNVDSNGCWTTCANWTGCNDPNGFGDDAVFSSVITAARTITLNANINLDELRFDSANNYTITGANTLSIDNDIDVFNTNGCGAHTVASDIRFAGNVDLTQNSSGLFTLSGAICGGNCNYTKTGTGTVAHTGSIAGGFNRIRINGGEIQALTGDTWCFNQLQIAQAGGSTGILTINCGTDFCADGLSTIGNNSTGTGTVNILGCGSSLTVSNHLSIGHNGTGNVFVSCNTSLSTVGGLYAIRLGYNSGSSGTLTVTGACATVSTGRCLIVGNSGTGTLFVNCCATISVGRQLIVGNNSGSAGTINISSGSCITTSHNIVIGRAGTGTATVSGGSSLTSSGARDIRIGYNSSGVGSLTITGPCSIVCAGDDFEVGISGDATLIVSCGGSAIAGDDFRVANGSNSDTTVTMTGATSSITAADRIFKGSGDATLNLSDGTVTTDQFTGSTNSGTGIINFCNVTVIAGASNADFIRDGRWDTINSQAGGVTFDTSGNNITIDNSISGVGGVTKNGAGTMTYTGTANTYTGTTTVNAGTLLLGASNQIAQVHYY